ncbi:thiamineS protein [uncultured Candidatus Thioglobus sp.]|nr:thiamineS protein [uncultured Candidatus Thioglobus sp.]
MQITLKLYATLSEYLPSHAQNNRVQINIDADTTLYHLLEQYNIPKERAHLVLLNGVYLTPKQRQQALFKDNDTMAIWPPVAGG